MKTVVRGGSDRESWWRVSVVSGGRWVAVSGGGGAWQEQVCRGQAVCAGERTLERTSMTHLARNATTSDTTRVNHGSRPRAPPRAVVEVIIGSPALSTSVDGAELRVADGCVEWLCANRRLGTECDVSARRGFDRAVASIASPCLAAEAWDGSAGRTVALFASNGAPVAKPEASLCTNGKDGASRGAMSARPLSSSPCTRMIIHS
jgi:hypothetical protein